MENPVLFIPVLTTFLSAVFGTIVFQRFREKEGHWHLLWWSAGIYLFGVGTFMEGFTAIFGWHEGIFRAWYISGALLGGAPLAQGTVYLLLSRRTANTLTAILVPYIVLAALCVLLTPIDASLAEEHRLTADVIEWTWVRGLSPIVNTYAFIFLVGGAIVSAMRYNESGEHRERVLGNVLIAVGAVLPGIGGTFTRMGYTEVLYVTEFIGILFIFAGYRLNVGKSVPLVWPGAEPATA